MIGQAASAGYRDFHSTTNTSDGDNIRKRLNIAMSATQNIAKEAPLPRRSNQQNFTFPNTHHLIIATPRQIFA